MLRLILDHPDAANYDLDGVKYRMTGTAPSPHDSVKRHRRFGRTSGSAIRTACPKVASASAPIATLRSSNLVVVGKLPPHMQLRDENGDVISTPGTVGEIYGHQQHRCRYWNDPEATAASFIGGWTKTGDLGYVDEEGDLIMAGRSKELIIRGGYNITPLEIETVLHLHPSVQQAAVVGVDHEVLGEDIAAAVTMRRAKCQSR
jgi:acyl-CoA synthetase (AMP-forming)/AMP-acid ligase II